MKSPEDLSNTQTKKKKKKIKHDLTKFNFPLVSRFPKSLHFKITPFLNQKFTYGVKEKTTVGLMVALFGMHENPLANNKVNLKKKLFNLKIVENALVAQDLNEFNTITIQMSSVKI